VNRTNPLGSSAAVTSIARSARAPAPGGSSAHSSISGTSPPAPTASNRISIWLETVGLRDATTCQPGASVDMSRRSKPSEPPSCARTSMRYGAGPSTLSARSVAVRSSVTATRSPSGVNREAMLRSNSRHASRLETSDGATFEITTGSPVSSSASQPITIAAVTASTTIDRHARRFMPASRNGVPL
jgi:hypothetical protein